MTVTTIDRELIASIIQPRKKNSHKGDYGHGSIIAGSKGMMGAAVLSSKAFMRAGAGKLTAQIPECGYEIMQISVPEAMCRICGNDFIESVEDLDNYDAIGIGPGLSQQPTHSELLSRIFDQFKKPLVVDADALNIIAKNKFLLDKIPAGSILTPHTAEFERIFGEQENNNARKEIAIQQARKYNIVIILKGPNSFVAAPDGRAYVNTTGNPGMATGGTGDVLTGIVTAMLAQQLSPEKAAVAAVFLHGLAGDIAAASESEHALIASDVISCLGKAFITLSSGNNY